MEKYWTKEKCFEVAKTCKTIKEFIKNYNTAYIQSIIHGWRKDYTWLERTIKLDMETPNYLIYPLFYLLHIVHYYIPYCMYLYN